MDEDAAKHIFSLCGTLEPFRRRSDSFRRVVLCFRRRLAAGTGRDIHSAQKKKKDLKKGCNLLGSSVRGFLVHVPQTSPLPLQRNKCTNDFVPGRCVLGLEPEQQPRLERSGVLFVCLFFTCVVRFQAHSSLTCADGDVCSKRSITRGLHFDVAKKSSDCAILQLLFLSRPGRRIVHS